LQLLLFFDGLNEVIFVSDIYSPQDFEHTAGLACMLNDHIQQQRLAVCA
jgi:hypothetical protein